MRRALPLIALCALALLASCGISRPTALPEGMRSPFVGYASPKYRQSREWLCLPGRAGDRCQRDMRATEIHADGTKGITAPILPESPKVDCFYVYPTVDLSFFSGNTEMFDDVAAIADATFAQAAHFREVCALYVPLYRQVTIGTYFRKGEAHDQPLRVAFSDVADAFLHYMGQYNRGRKLVLVGHSQGAHMIARLLSRYFDDDPSMRERLLLAMPIGGEVEVPKGALVGGTFAHIPLCSRPNETGCVVAYRSHRAQEAVLPRWNTPPAGFETACVSPASVDAPGTRTLARSIFPLSNRFRSEFRNAEGVTTPFLAVRNFYSATCVEGNAGYHYLAVSAMPPEGDLRTSPIDWGGGSVRGATGLHMLDMQFTQGDLIEMIRRRAAAL